MTLSVVTLPEGQLRSPKETLMSVEFFYKLLLGNRELRDSCSEQFSHHWSRLVICYWCVSVRLLSQLNSSGIYVFFRQLSTTHFRKLVTDLYRSRFLQTLVVTGRGTVQTTYLRNQANLTTRERLDN